MVTLSARHGTVAEAGHLACHCAITLASEEKQKGGLRPYPARMNRDGCEKSLAFKQKGSYFVKGIHPVTETCAHLPPIRGKSCYLQATIFRSLIISSMLSFAHPIRALMCGSKVFVLSVRAYSTRGGTSGYIVRVT